MRMNILYARNKLTVGVSERGTPIYWNPVTNNNLLLAGTHAWGMIQSIVDSGLDDDFQFVVANLYHEDEVDSALSQAKTFEELEWMVAWIYSEYSLRCNEPMIMVRDYPKVVCVIRGLNLTDDDFVETLRFLIVNGHYVGIHFIVVYDDPCQVSPLVNLDFQMRALAGSCDVERKFFSFPTCNLNHYIDSFEFKGVFLPLSVYGRDSNGKGHKPDFGKKLGASIFNPPLENEH